MAFWIFASRLRMESDERSRFVLQYYYACLDFCPHVLQRLANHNHNPRPAHLTVFNILRVPLLSNKENAF